MIEVGIALIGIVLFIAGFIVPERLTNTTLNSNGSIDSESLKNMIEKELDQVKSKVDIILENTIEDVAEQTEKSLEKITNEKIMAVNEYSDSVLREIQKTYNEVIFVYSMLNDKEKELKELVTKVKSVPVDKNLETAVDIKNTQPKQVIAKDENRNQFNQASGIYAKKKEMEKYDIKNNNSKVLSLNKAGKNEIEIARQLGLGVGEVRLVLDLFKGARV